MKKNLAMQQTDKTKKQQKRIPQITTRLEQIDKVLNKLYEDNALGTIPQDRYEQMTTINLKDFYPWYTHDEYIEVSEEVADELRASRLYEAAYQRRIVRNKAQYSLDCEDGIEYSACVSEPTPQELLERMELFCHLCAALNSLPETQGRRVDACVILGKSYREVAMAEGVSKTSVQESVQSGLTAMRKYLKKVL